MLAEVDIFLLLNHSSHLLIPTPPRRSTTAFWCLHIAIFTHTYVVDAEVDDMDNNNLLCM